MDEWVCRLPRAAAVLLRTVYQIASGGRFTQSKLPQYQGVEEKHAGEAGGRSINDPSGPPHLAGTFEREPKEQ
jgi:hypothetical protein